MEHICTCHNNEEPPASQVVSPHIGRGGCTKSTQNPGIAKKGEGGSDPYQDFFGGFDRVHRGQPKLKNISSKLED